MGPGEKPARWGIAWGLVAASALGCSDYRVDLQRAGSELDIQGCSFDEAEQLREDAVPWSALDALSVRLDPIGGRVEICATTGSSAAPPCTNYDLHGEIEETSKSGAYSIELDDGTIAKGLYIDFTEVTASISVSTETNRVSLYASVHHKRSCRGGCGIEETDCRIDVSWTGDSSEDVDFLSPYSP